MDQLARTIFGDEGASEAVCKIPLHFLRFQMHPRISIKRARVRLSDGCLIITLDACI